MEGYELPSEVMTKKLHYLRDKLSLLRSKVSGEKEYEKREIVEIVDSIAKVSEVLDRMLKKPTYDNVIQLTGIKMVTRIKMEKLKKRLPKFGHHCSEFEYILISLDFLDMKDQEKGNLLVEMNYLFYKLKNIDKRKMSEDDEKDFQRMSEIFIKHLPNLQEPWSDIDKILYKNGMLQVDEQENKPIIDVEELFVNIDVLEFFCAYYNMVIGKNTVNQCIDDAFLKLIVCRARTKTWHLNKFILELLESKIMYRICIGMKIFKTNFKANGFKNCIGQELCYAVSDLSKITGFIDQDENKMAIFVAKHAKECHALIEECNLPKLPAYKARDIFMEIKDRKVIGQYEIRALYEIIKSGRRYPKILSDLEYGSITGIVHSFLFYIRRFYARYEKLDKEMREIDEHNGQGFGEFSLEVVTNDDEKKPHTLNKYFFYDDAMKTLSILSFLYNCVKKSYQKFDTDKLKQFKVKSYVTQLVITLIRQYDQTNKIDRPIWIMEKILKTCHFIVFGHDEETEKDIFLRLMNEDEIGEDLSCLKNFMKKNKLNYGDEGCDYEYH